MHVGTVELHDPVEEVPSPKHVIGVELERPKPAEHVNVHELPVLLLLVHTGAFPLLGASVEREEGHVIAENKYKHCFINR